MSKSAARHQTYSLFLLVLRHLRKMFFRYCGKRFRRFIEIRLPSLLRACHDFSLRPLTEGVQGRVS